MFNARIFDWLGNAAHAHHRAPSPQILYHTAPEEVDFTTDASVTKSGSTLTYGPFNNLPESTNEDFVETKQKRITVQYNYDVPVLEVNKLESVAEISHWGSNLNIQHTIWLQNAGPK